MLLDVMTQLALCTGTVARLFLVRIGQDLHVSRFFSTSFSGNSLCSPCMVFGPVCPILASPDNSARPALLDIWWLWWKLVGLRQVPSNDRWAIIKHILKSLKCSSVERFYMYSAVLLLALVVGFIANDSRKWKSGWYPSWYSETIQFCGRKRQATLI